MSSRRLFDRLVALIQHKLGGVATNLQSSRVRQCSWPQLAAQLIQLFDRLGQFLPDAVQHALGLGHFSRPADWAPVPLCLRQRCLRPPLLFLQLLDMCGQALHLIVPLQQRSRDLRLL